MTVNFSSLGIQTNLVELLKQAEITIPTQIQEKAIPALLAGKDVLAQAQTGSGKTAAFTLPIIQQLDSRNHQTQCLILTPTRELAIQVAKVCKEYSKNAGIKVSTIYGGDDYKRQLQSLKMGCQLVVGTPGRVMDHMRRGTLSLSHLKHLVLDEADEMLKMGFLEDVSWILEQAPEKKQMALFSATLPKAVQAISRKFLHQPEAITIPRSEVNSPDISQNYIMAPLAKRAEIVARLIELRHNQGIIIFARTRAQTVELTTFLKKQGYKATAINGDLKQSERKRSLDMLDRGEKDIVVATDVAARGIDIARVNCVINFEAPFDSESYVHRIGRTGRAGRHGESILFINNHQKYQLKRLESETKGIIKKMPIPSAVEVNESRKNRLFEDISQASKQYNAGKYTNLVNELMGKLEANTVIGSLIQLLHKNQEFFLDENRDSLVDLDKSSSRMEERKGKRRDKKFSEKKDIADSTEMERYKLHVGKNHGVSPKNIVGAIANEAGINSRNIGQISIQKNIALFICRKECLRKFIIT